MATAETPYSASTTHEEYSINDYNTTGRNLCYSSSNDTMQSSNSTSYSQHLNNVEILPCRCLERCLLKNAGEGRNINNCELKKKFCDYFIKKILDILIRTSALIVNMRGSRDSQEFKCYNLTKTITSSINEHSRNLPETKNTSLAYQNLLLDKMKHFPSKISGKDDEVEKNKIYINPLSGNLLQDEHHYGEQINNDISFKENANYVDPTNTFDLNHHLTTNECNNVDCFLNNYNESCNSLQIPKPIWGIPLSQRAQVYLKSHGKIQDSVPESNWASNTIDVLDKHSGISLELNDAKLPHSLRENENSISVNNCKNMSDAFIISPYEFVGKYSDYQNYLIKSNKNASNSAYFCLPPNYILVPYQSFMETCKYVTIHNSDQSLNGEIKIEAETYHKINGSTRQQHMMNYLLFTPSNGEEVNVEQNDIQDRQYEIDAPINSQTFLYSEDMKHVHFGEGLKNEALDLNTMENYMFPPIHYTVVLPPTVFRVKSDCCTMAPIVTDFHY